MSPKRSRTLRTGSPASGTGARAGTPFTRAHVAEAVKDAPDRLAAERLGLEAFIAFTRRHPELYRIIEEAQFVAHDVYREHYLTFVEGYRQGLAAAGARG